MASMFWDSERVIHVDYLPNYAIIMTQYYSNFHRNDVRQAVQKDSARPHTLGLKATLQP
jgi:hypothetical protein